MRRRLLVLEKCCSALFAVNPLGRVWLLDNLADVRSGRGVMAPLVNAFSFPGTDFWVSIPRALPV